MVHDLILNVFLVSLFLLLDYSLLTAKQLFFRITVEKIYPFMHFEKYRDDALSMLERQIVKSILQCCLLNRVD